MNDTVHQLSFITKKWIKIISHYPKENNFSQFSSKILPPFRVGE